MSEHGPRQSEGQPPAGPGGRPLAAPGTSEGQSPHDGPTGTALERSLPADAQVPPFAGPVKPGTAALLKWFSAACVLLFVLDFLVERKSYAPSEHLPGFYPVFGFLGGVLLVLVAKELRKVVARDGDHYGRKEDA